MQNVAEMSASLERGVTKLLDCFAYRFLTNRDTRLELDIQPPGTDAEYDQYITEMGLERREAPRQALLKGIVG